MTKAEQPAYPVQRGFSYGLSFMEESGFFATDSRFSGDKMLPKIGGESAANIIAMQSEIIPWVGNRPVHVLDLRPGKGRSGTEIMNAYDNVLVYSLTNALPTVVSYSDREGCIHEMEQRTIPVDVALSNLRADPSGRLANGVDTVINTIPFNLQQTPFTVLAKHAFDVVNEGGFAFLAHSPTQNTRIDGLDELQGWLDENGYKAEFKVDIRQPSMVTGIAFERTRHSQLLLPLRYQQNGASAFDTNIAKQLNPRA